MNRELDILVDECITRMQTEGWSVEQCLAANPGHQDVLGPLLVLSTEIHSYLSPESPDAQFAINAKKRIQNQIQTSFAAKVARKPEISRIRTRWFLRPAYVLASLVLVIALLTGGVGVVNASAASLPGDALYGIKIARERVALTISLSAERDQKLLTGFAETRLHEAEALIQQNRIENLPTAVQGFEDTLDELEGLTAEHEDLQPGSLEHLQTRLDIHIQVLEGVIKKAPAAAQQALQQALERSSHSREVLKKVHGEGHPSDRAPGQNRPDAEDKDKDMENSPGNSDHRRGPKPKDENQTGPPPWANIEK